MSASNLVIEPAVAADLDAVGRLLAGAGLAHDDLRPETVRLLVARAGKRVIGAIGAEVRAPDALLRSLVVAPDHRREGVGEALVRRLDADAAAWGVRRWWLLTTTAERFFRARGFFPVERAAAPESIRLTGQFSGGICASAVCLSRAREGAS